MPIHGGLLLVFLSVWKLKAKTSEYAHTFRNKKTK